MPIFDPFFGAPPISKLSADANGSLWKMIAFQVFNATFDAHGMLFHVWLTDFSFRPEESTTYCSGLNRRPMCEAGVPRSAHRCRTTTAATIKLVHFFLPTRNEAEQGVAYYSPQNAKASLWHKHRSQKRSIKSCPFSQEIAMTEAWEIHRLFGFIPILFWLPIWLNDAGKTADSCKQREMSFATKNGIMTNTKPPLRLIFVELEPHTAHTPFFFFFSTE